VRVGEPAAILTRDALAQTADAIAGMQEPDGAIPWFPGGHTEAWDHLECAMALQLGGRVDAADAAWEWLARNQRSDGSWPMKTTVGVIEDGASDSNQCAYVATAVWHRWRLTSDRAFVTRLWPVVRAALDFVVELQHPGGQIWWARSVDGAAYPESLLAGCSSILHSLRCGLALAELVGEPQPEWEVGVGALRHALRAHPECFLPRDRWSMDWYYPVIGGALRGAEGRARLRSRWDDFVVDGLGIRCVDDEPWVTGAETCELAIALHLVGQSDAGARLVRDMQHLRHDDGSYWTGWQFVAEVNYPEERSSWTAAAVILAVDTLAGGVTEAVFRGDDLPHGLPVLAADSTEANESAAEATVLGCGCGSVGGQVSDPNRSVA
jgi:MMP endo-(1,4)-3-O-methyl-alpha-D-mannosidase